MAPKWDEAARALNNSRTPFQCFKQYEKLTENTGTPTKQDDELLLKYIAASGPQFTLNHNTTTLLSQRYFPHLSTIQILLRSTISLVNPNFKNERWSDYEERMLVLGMKVFCEDEYSTSQVASLLPNRSNKLVSDKWNRCMNPIYSTQPFSKSENERLVSAVKESNVNASSDWKVIAKMFPLRNPRSLLSRYLELTKDD